MGLSNEDVCSNLMERLECSVVNCSSVLMEPFRLDSEYYSKGNLRLEDLIKSTNGRTIASLNGVVDCSAFYPSITGYYSNDKSLVPFIRVNEIQNGLVILTDDTVFLSQKVLDDNRSTISKAYPGDIVIAKGGNTLAKVGLVTKEYPVYAACRDVIILRTDKLKDINRYYLWSFLHSKYGQQFMWRSASQTGQPHITLPIISNMHIPLLGEEIQRQVKDLYVLSMQKQKDSELKFEEAEALLHTMLKIEDAEEITEKPVISSLHEIMGFGRIDAEYHQLKYKRIKECIEANDHFYLNDDAIIDQNVTPAKEEICRYIELSNVGKNGIVTGCTRALGRELPSRARRIVQKGDVILSSIEGSLEKCAIIDEKYDGAYCSNGFYVIRTKELMPEALLVVMKSWELQQLLKKACSGTILTAFSKDELKNIPIPGISHEIQERIAVLVRESIALHNRSEHLLNEAKELIERKIMEMTGH